MKIIKLKKQNIAELVSSLRVSNTQDSSVQEIVEAILRDVRARGDEALFEYTAKFDACKLNTLLVSSEEIKQAFAKTDKALIDAIKFAKKNIEQFHKTTFVKKDEAVFPIAGVKLWREFKPIEKVGLYVPGGKAAYPSTVLMLAVPAKLAGCREVIMCTPASPSGECNAAVLVAAALCGVEKIYKLGGAQAIYAMAYGTKSVCKVQKDFGPGNAYVTAAKMRVFGEVDIDMPAGPSELMIMADDSVDPAWVAADFLSQLEHGVDSQAILLTCDLAFATAVKRQVVLQAQTLSRREIIKKSLLNSVVVLCDTNEQMLAFANEYAPEHLQIMLAKGQTAMAKKVLNAGSVFIGSYACEALGDYASGANHTLPTAGFAKMFSPLSVESFGKKLQMQSISKEGLQNLYASTVKMAESEGLDAHAASVKVRFNK